MKKLILALAILSTSTMAHAAPVLFEINYLNHAWGYNNHGCFVDQLGFIYNYNVRSGKPFENVGQVSKQELDLANDLLMKAYSGKVTTRHAMADAGIISWTGQYGGKSVLLKGSGDFRSENSAPESKKLVELMDKWCK